MEPPAFMWCGPDPVRLTPTPHEIVTAFLRHTTVPNQAQRKVLADRSIALWSMAGAPGTGEWHTGFARIGRLDDGRFEFSAEGVSAMAVIALDECGDPADIVAWPLKAGWIAAWIGRASMLGLRNVTSPRIEAETLTIHPDAFSWLRDERRGVVLVDEPRACRELREYEPFLAAGGIKHGERLRALMTRTPPVILVPVRPERRAA